jgi:hypothetical protein
MKYYLTIIIFLLAFTGHPQNSPINDSIHFENKIGELTERIESLRTGNSTLEKDLLYYRAKEDYYSAALADQSTRFALIASGLLLAFSFISYAGFRYEIKKFKKASDERIKKVSKTYKKSKAKFDKLKTQHFKSEGNLAATISGSLREKEMIFEAAYYSMVAADAHNSHCERILKEMTEEEISEREDMYSAVFGNLKTAINTFNDLVENGSISKYQIKDSEKFLKEIFQNLLKSKNQAVMEKTAEIYIQYQILSKKSQEDSKTESD